ncbi:MAG TPA: DNA repair ATPase [Thermoanaerobaculia bacterium]
MSIERGTYEVIRDRLLGHGKTLSNKASALNKRRIGVFGGTEMAVLGADRIRTENNCVPRDIVEVGANLLFGYNVFIGLKTETTIADVFSLHRFTQTESGFEFSTLPQGETFLGDEKFVRDFKELYQYYRNSRLLQLRRVDGKLLMVFQTSDKVSDIRVFRWAVDPKGNVTYIDNRGERDHVFPPRHDFEWTLTTREDHILGRFPHVSILDEVFVETIGGDLTIKVEDNTETGRGIYAEPVDERDQSLDDAQIRYAAVGSLLLLEVLPYREKTKRYFVYNRRTKHVQRIDAIGHACIQLPEDHGIIFPGGYYLRTGEAKLFDHDPEQMEFLRTVRAPNGEDVLYAFHRRDEGRTLLFPYNLIRKEVVNPLTCHGYSLYDDGKLVIFEATGAEPTRVHAMRIWQTPFVSDDHAAKAPKTGSFLEKIGNRDLVRGLSDALTICRLIDEQSPTRATYEDLVAAAKRVADAYYWLGNAEAEDLLSTVREVWTTAEQIIDEFEKVEALRAQAKKSVDDAEAALTALFATIRPDSWTSIDDYVGTLAELRAKQGQVISLRELRYVARPKLDALEQQIVTRFGDLSKLTVQFLLGEKALAPFAEKSAAIEARIAGLTKTPEADKLVAEVEGVVASLNLLTEIIGSLEIEDPTTRIQILERISTLLAGLNRVRALAGQRRKELLGKERVAEFGVQFQLFAQTVANALSVADSPDRCDSELSKLMLQLEELETRFSEFDDYVAQLGTKREEVYEALTARKQSLVEQRQRRAEQLAQAAERILQGIARRTATIETVDALNAFFASDAMVAKLRQTADKLRELNDVVRADEIDGRLKSARDEAARSLRDRRELFEEGSNIVKFGEHRFSVNTQPLELTFLPKEGRPFMHLTGTGFFESIEDPELDGTRTYWEQELVSETADVYRGEYLAYSLVQSKTPLASLREFAATRYDEGYERGVHDADAALIAEKLIGMLTTAGLLRYSPSARAAATLFWAFSEDGAKKEAWLRQAQSLRRLRAAIDTHDAIGRLGNELQSAIDTFLTAHGIELDAHHAGEYLFEEIAHEPLRFVLSADAATLLDEFTSHLRTRGHEREFSDDLRAMQGDLSRRHATVRAWVESFTRNYDATRSNNVGQTLLSVPRTPNADAGQSLAGTDKSVRPASIDEVVAAVVTNGTLSRERSSALTSSTVTGLLGQHARIVNGAMDLRLDEFLTRVSKFAEERVPGFRAYQQVRHRILERERKRLRLSEYQPKVMSSFVRNRLINDVYLPLIGANLAKQMGAAGNKKRTDLMGLLLLVSPPGYGKTTLMEYIANRLGLVFMKINGPALGHAVRSLDPNEAPNATAKQEIIKLNLGLEMGNNVLLYVDDIQHTHPEFLQKFISLCDAQRKIEGVWRGETKTYDLRGKRFAVCMAGNPYTESGEKFEIPDMLANRADVYNLGEVLQGKDSLFELSYIENSLTSNPVTAPLLTRDMADVDKLVRIARGEAIQTDQLSHDYSSVELSELLAVVKKMVRVQSLLSQVNRQYVLSAAQQSAYRTEPPFKLQGSYRNMNKLSEKILPAMNDQELERLIDDHYLGEAQTLTTGAEENLLKLAELRGVMTDVQRARWDEIKRGFTRLQRMGNETDPAARVMAELSVVSDRIGDVTKAIHSAARNAAPVVVSEPAPAAAASSSEDITPWLEKLDATLRALRELHERPTPAPIMMPIAATPSAPAQDLVSREAYLLKDTLIPLLRFMAHRFRSYRSVADPKIKQAIAKLERVDDLGSLVAALENINISALAKLTEE